MNFEWDEKKRLSNLAKHGIDFRDCVSMFAGKHKIFQDNRAAYGEERLNAFWRLSQRLVVTTFVLREDAIRIISTRKANTREEKRHGTDL